MENEEKLKGLKSSDYGVRRHTAEKLGRLQVKDAVPELIELLEDTNWNVRKAAVSALGSIGEKSAASALLPVLRDTDWFVREAAAVALGKLGDVSAVSALRECLQDEVFSVKKAANSALQKLGVETERPASAPGIQVPSGGQAAEGKAVQEQEGKKDSRSEMVSAFRELGASFTTVGNGFDLRIGVGEGRNQKLRVRFEDGQIIYLTECGPATPNNYLWALKANYAMNYGSLAVVDIESQHTFVVVERQLEENADREQIRKLIWGVAAFADSVEESLTDEDKR